MKLNDIEAYEKIPNGPLSARILYFDNSKYIFTPHWHEHTEIHFFFKNGGLLRYGEKQTLLSEGDCVIINGNEMHSGEGTLDGICDYLCLIIPPSFFEFNYIIFKEVIRDGYVAELIEKIYEKNTVHSAVDMLEIKGLLYLLVSYLIRNYTMRSLTEPVYSKHFNKLNTVNEATCYISQHYDEPLTTKTLSSYVHLSEGYFCQIFKEVTGKTAVEYINHVRIGKAEQMLRKTDMTVTEIALSCGFSGSNYFARAYKKEKGESPLATRRCK